MRLTERVTLIDTEGDEHETVCYPLLIRGGEAEESGVRVPQGALQLVIDEQGVTEDWTVVFKTRQYGIAGIVPYLKRKLPTRVVLACIPEVEGV